MRPVILFLYFWPPPNYSYDVLNVRMRKRLEFRNIGNGELSPVLGSFKVVLRDSFR